MSATTRYDFWVLCRESRAGSERPAPSCCEIEAVGCGSIAPLAADWWGAELDLTFKSIMARNGRWKKCSCITIIIEKAVGVRSSNRRLAFVCWRSPRLYNLLQDINENFLSYCIKRHQTQSYTKLLKHQNPSPLCQTIERHQSIREFVSQTTNFF